MTNEERKELARTLGTRAKKLDREKFGEYMAYVCAAIDEGASKEEAIQVADMALGITSD